MKSACVKRGLSQTQLAELVGCDQSYVSRCEKGDNNYGREIAPKVADALGISVVDVLYPKPDAEDDAPAKTQRKRAA